MLATCYQKINNLLGVSSLSTACYKEVGVKLAKVTDLLRESYEETALVKFSLYRANNL